MRKTFLLIMLAGAARAQVNFEHGDWRALREQSRFLQPIHPLPLWGRGRGWGQQANRATTKHRIHLHTLIPLPRM